MSIDSNEFATLPPILGVVHASYPLYTWLGFLFSRLLPFGDVAHRINVMSAVLGAASIGGLYRVSIRLLPSDMLPLNYQRSVAVTGALLFAFSRTFWSQAVIAEVYAPNVVLVALTLLVLLRWNDTRSHWDFFFFAFTFGLSLGTHLSNLGFAPGMVLFVVMTIAGASSLPAGSAWIRPGILADAGLAGFGLGAIQFVLWPPRPGALQAAAVLQDVPATLTDLYRHVQLGFSEFRQAFSLVPPPDRLVVYTDWLRIQFGLIGIALGVIGLVFLLIRRPRYFCLLMGMYVVHVWFFTQYKVFDLDVFFIPTHFLWAMFIAVGLAVTLMGVAGLVQSTGLNMQMTQSIHAALALSIPLSCLVPLAYNWSENDRSQDVAINDFYASVWEYLPEGAALITPWQGYEAFYWRTVYQTRPDVLLPFLQDPQPVRTDLGGRDVYATERALRYAYGGGALGPPRLVDYTDWQLPVILGGQSPTSFGGDEPQVLYHISATPPSLLVANPRPQRLVNVDLGSVVLMGMDLDPAQVESGAAVHLVLYWKLKGMEPTRVMTSLGSTPLEQHEVGFKLLTRYAKTVDLRPGSVVAERYGLVIPSTTPPGVWPLTLGKVGPGGRIDESVPLGTLEVVNRLGTMERWLRIADLD
jgi:hypothetical protein